MWDLRTVVTTINHIYTWAIQKKIFKYTPLFWQDYSEDFPELLELEKLFPEIKAECLKILDLSSKIPNLEDIGGNYTSGGVHSIEWKSYMLKLGDLIDVNCQRCPQTTLALSKVPRAKVAFFSILYPGQHIEPHVGYYKGFLRYHLGIKIPKGDGDNTCWLRVSDNPPAQNRQETTPVDQGEFYHWKEGEGIIFDDLLLHEAANETEDIRVVLFVDVCRPMPSILDTIHQSCVDIVVKSPFFNNMRSNAAVCLPTEP